MQLFTLPKIYIRNYFFLFCLFFSLSGKQKTTKEVEFTSVYNRDLGQENALRRWWFCFWAELPKKNKKTKKTKQNTHGTPFRELIWPVVLVYVHNIYIYIAFQARLLPLFFSEVWAFSFVRSFLSSRATGLHRTFVFYSLTPVDARWPSL